MESAPPISATWIPEDDLLLKNAMEAGASLEALGKGAVKFSRRFTYKELRDRWHSILYDPNVADHASAHMFELLVSGIIHTSKSIKSENYKGHKDIPERRKRSVRKQYYSMRKRLRSEFFSSTHLGFLSEPIINGCQDHGSNMRENHDGKFVSDGLRLQKAELDILRNVFPETVRHYDASSVGRSNKACAAECRNPIRDDSPNIIFRNEFPPDVSSVLRENERGPSVPDIKCYEISCAAKSNAPTSGKFRADKESGSVQVLPGKSLFRSSGKKQLSVRDSGLDNPQSSCGFGGSQLVSSPNAESNSPLQVIGCSSPHPNLPIWKTMEDFSVPSMPVCMGNQGTAQVVGTLLPDDVAGKGVTSSVFDIVQSGPFSGLEQNNSDLMPSVASDGDFVDISDSLLNLSNEDELPFTDVNEKEAVDKIGNDNVNQVLANSIGAVQGEVKVKLESEMLNSGESSIILRNSPKAVQLVDEVKLEKEVVNKIDNDNVNLVLENSTEGVQGEDKVKLESEMLNSGESSIILRNSARVVQLEKIKSEPHLMMVQEPNTSTPTAAHHLDGNLPIEPVDGSIPFTSTVSTESRELDNDIIWCTLNTEDPEIPCNDDIFLLIHPSPVFSSSTSPPFTGDTMSPTSISKGKIIEQQMNSSSNGKVISKSFKWHQSARPSCSWDYLSCDSKPKLLDAPHVGVPPTNGSRSLVDLSVNRLCHVTSYPSTYKLSGKEISRAQLKDEDNVVSFLEMPQYAEAGQLAAIEPAMNTTLSDSEESQSDDDVPYTSDVESMILGMDLDPPEEESSITKQAFILRPEDSKTIMRLEQCARSSLQRTLTNQGAFAILYGRHLRQYIKKTEVVLGRSTDDLEVDIDLRKEGRANKISRQQAIIKMEPDGSFSLKNIGKVAISVNGKSVHNGQSLILSSNCLIEISRMSLAFEINQKYVRRHMDATARKMTQKDRFDWSSDEIS